MSAFSIGKWLPFAVALLSVASAQQGSTCSAEQPCISGCCSKDNYCGFTPDHCGAGCQSNCDAKAECGVNSVQTLCPLSVCCSPDGYCGTTELFCGTGCQNGCAPVPSPSCPSTDSNPLGFERRVAYYELTAVTRACDGMQPEAIPAGALTHINIAFAEFDKDYNVVDAQGDIVARVSRLKAIYPQLRVNVAIGGWNFNDPPTQSYFSNMASSETSRQQFIESLALYLTKYGLDGVDLDWEYPGAPDRGGVPADTENYVALVAQMRSFFDSYQPGWEISITLPSSYWYMRGYDLQGLERSITYFNFLSYDLHGDWDYYNNYTGPYLRGQTNLTEINEGFDLLWRNSIDPANIVMGMAFYGRSFTMRDASCHTADCEFTGGGIAGDCSDTVGILYYSEIASANGTINAETYYDPESTVKYTVFDYSQWVSYDDQQSWSAKLEYLGSKCLSGLLIWAIDQDTPQYTALTGLLGPEAAQSALLQGGNLSSSELDQLADEFAAYTGQNCYLTPVCTNGEESQSGPGQVCGLGYTSISTQHGFAQIYPGSEYTLQGFCSVGWFRHICCPTTALPQHCEWINEPPPGSEACGNRTCGSDQFELSSDDYATAGGDLHTCQGDGSGVRRLCCDSTEVLDQCSWGSCQGPFDDSVNVEFLIPPLSCPSGMEVQTYRYNGAGSSCAAVLGSPENTFAYAQPLCCPTNDVPQNCSWSNDPNINTNYIAPFGADIYCSPQPCSPGTVKIADAFVPPNSSRVQGVAGNSGNEINCLPYQNTPGTSVTFPYCCNPPMAYNENWPVPPSYLWSNAYSSEGSEVQWAYADNFGNNNMETTPDPEKYGDDPYGFIMLDGPDGSLQPTFSDDYTFTHESHVRTNVKRELLTTNRTHLDEVFVHQEEIAYIYCNHPTGSPQCNRIFHKGAEDTIIRLPAYVGEGPFARVVSMELAGDTHRLAAHHLRARQIQRNDNPVYRLRFDYDFHLIKRSETVNMRVDYTNLQDYWAQLTDSPAPSGSRRRRSVVDDHLSQSEWKERVRAAKTKHWERKEKRQETNEAKAKRDIFAERAATVKSYVPTKLGKRWFGDFVAWLNKLNTVENSAVGYLNMLWQKSVLLYRAKAGCPTSTAYAELSIYLDADVNLEATYAYYFSGTIVPPTITGTYAYFGLQPNAYLGVTVDGYAQLQYTSPRNKIIQTIAYPGLAIKGIAAVGPTLDVYGQIQGIVTLSGTMQIGYRFSFEKQEWYWPADSDSASYNELLGLAKQPESVPSGIVPEFSANVEATARLDILITPEANMGIQVGGGSLVGTLVQADIVGYVNTTTRFYAHAGAQSDGSYSYGYSVSLLYNIGYGAIAKIPLFPWYATISNLYSPMKQITLYSNEVTSAGSTDRRSLSDAASRVPRRGLLNSVISEELSLPEVHVEPVVRSKASSKTAESWGSNFTMPSDGSLTSFAKRQQSDSQVDGDVPDFSLWQLFECPKPTNCKECLCSQSSKTEDLDHGILNIPKSGAGPPCPSKLPELRVNCEVFADVQVVSQIGGRHKSLTGICNPEKDFMNSIGLNGQGMVLTLDGGDPAKRRVASRRRFSCPKNFCRDENMALDSYGGGANLVSCDEFPFATTEEGGRYFGQVRQHNGVAVSAVCVPDYQQVIQGQCLSMLSRLSTNVFYNDYGKTRDPEWVDWSSPSWTETDPVYKNDQGEAIYQRLAEYPTRQYQGNLPDQTNDRLSYMFKRNFTYGLAYPEVNQGAAWSNDPSYQFKSFKIPGNPHTYPNSGLVVCALNTFGQDDIYKTPRLNGYCTISTTLEVVYNVPQLVGCIITWGQASSDFKKKRDSLGSFNGWEIKDIRIPDDAPVFDLPDVPPEFFDQLGPKIPFGRHGASSEEP